MKNTLFGLIVCLLFFCSNVFSITSLNNDKSVDFKLIKDESLDDDSLNDDDIVTEEERQEYKVDMKDYVSFQYASTKTITRK